MSHLKHARPDHGDQRMIELVANAVTLYDGKGRDVMVMEWDKTSRPMLPKSYHQVFRNINIADHAYASSMRAYKDVAQELHHLSKQYPNNNGIQVALTFYSEIEQALVSELAALDACPPLPAECAHLRPKIAEANQLFLRVVNWYKNIAAEIRQIARRPRQYQQDLEWERQHLINY